MARGRYLSLGEPRKSGKLDRFAKEHLSNGNWKHFDRMFASMVRRRLRESGEQNAKHQMRSLPKVISILKLFHILLKMLPRHVNMRPQDRQFQTNPKPLKTVDVAVAIHIFTCPMVDRLMGITRLVQPSLHRTAIRQCVRCSHVQHFRPRPVEESACARLALLSPDRRPPT